jgi:DNA invertase Pin-like site-specific DNA recombinase
MKVGYARVSSQDQDYSYQLKALEDAGCQPDMIFKDKASGKRMSRPEFDRMLTYLREGDVVVVWKIDRLGRNFTEMVATLAALFKRGIHIVATSQGVDTSTPMGKAMAYFLGIVAEMELEFNQERTRRSLELKRQRGIKGGRPRHPILSDPKKLAIIREMYDSKRYTVRQICETFGLKDKTSLYRYLRQAMA